MLCAVGGEADGGVGVWLWITQIPVIAVSGAYTVCSVNSSGASLTRTTGLTHVYSHTFMCLLTFASLSVRLQGESYWAAAAHPSGRVFTCPVAAAIVDGAGLCRWRDRMEKEKEKKRVLTMDLLEEHDKSSRDTEGGVG